MKNCIKMIVFDVGNTLIDTERTNKMTKLLVETLDVLRNKGYLIGIATLRNEEKLRDILEQFDFDFCILMNGGLVKVNEKIIYYKPLDSNLVKIVQEEANKKNVKCLFYKNNDDIVAIELMDAKNKIKIKQNVEQFVWEKSGNIDITSKGVNKVTGLKAVQSHFCIKKDEIMAFGDGFNDINMFENVGYSVAISGCPNELKIVADDIADTAREDGVVKALKKIGFV